MSFSDDTQPKSPFKTPPVQQSVTPPPDLDLSGFRDDSDIPGPSGPGCFVWGLLGIFLLGLAFVIVALSGAAGWTAGQRTAQGNATATQSAVISEQLGRIPSDLQQGNLALVDVRIKFLLTLTPGVPGVSDIVQTATSAYLTAQPTITTTMIPTQPVAEVTPEAVIPTSLGGAYDLASLMGQSQVFVTQRNWPDAIELLDTIRSIDSGYETASVTNLLLQSLNEYATELYRVGTLAEAIVMTDRAEEIGPLAEGLNYERYVATMYLDAIRTVGTSYPAAIQALTRVYSEVPQYRDVSQLLFQQYVEYGDAWAGMSEYCPAYGQYNGALSIFNDASVITKRDNANTMCQQATPAGVPVGTPGVGQTVAPVGQPGS